MASCPRWNIGMIWSKTVICMNRRSIESSPISSFARPCWWKKQLYALFPPNVAPSVCNYLKWKTHKTWRKCLLFCLKTFAKMGKFGAPSKTSIFTYICWHIRPYRYLLSEMWDATNNFGLVITCWLRVARLNEAIFLKAKLKLFNHTSRGVCSLKLRQRMVSSCSY